MSNIELIDTPANPILPELFDLYRKAFGEELSGAAQDHPFFKEVQYALGRNSEPEKYLWMAVKDSHGKVVGGSSFVVFPGSPDANVSGTVEANFLFLDPDLHGEQRAEVLQQILEERRKISEKIIAPEGLGNKKIEMFNEQDILDPAQVTVRQALENPDLARMHAASEKRGVKILANFDNTDPPIVPGGESQRYDRGVYGHENGEPVSTAVLKEHLRRFYERVFPEGSRMDHPDLQAMRDSLEALGDEIPLQPKDFIALDRAVQMLKQLPPDSLSEDDKNKPLLEFFSHSLKTTGGVEISDPTWAKTVRRLDSPKTILG